MSKVYKVGDVFYSKELKSYVKAVASYSECCDGDECELHRYDGGSIGDCSGFRFIKVAVPRQKAEVKEPKEYEWKGKRYVQSIGSRHTCLGCALKGDNCNSFKDMHNLGYCDSTRNFIEKPKETLETLMAKGERMANSIMGFNSSELPKYEFKPINFADFFKTNILANLPLGQVANKFIVSLIENGILQPSANPKIHNTIESAEMEAERLCRLHNQEFMVLKVTASFKPQQPKKEVFA